MENSGEIIKKLRLEGYDPVYLWNAEPNEEDLEHKHLFGTKLLVLDGEIEIRMDGKSTILKSGDEMNIPNEKTHYAKAGERGCKYIVAEKH